MEGLKSNSVIEILIQVYNRYIHFENLDPNRNTLTKKSLLQLFYDYNIIDTCGYNIFHMNEFIHQLSPDDNSIDLRKYLLLIFYIYRVQVEAEGAEDSEICDVTVNEINSISEDKIEIRKTNNIIRTFIEEYENKKTFHFCKPNLRNEEFTKILNYEILDQVSRYMYDFNDEVFCKYNSEDKDKGILYFNASKLNKYFVESDISSLFTGKELLTYSRLFYKFEIKFETLMDDLIGFFERPMNDVQIKELFENLNVSNLKEINFSYSSVLLLTLILSMHLRATENADQKEKIEFFFENILHLKRDDVNLFEEKVEDNVEEEQIEESLRDSETLKATKAKTTYGKEDIDFINEFLSSLDKILPPEDKQILDYANKYTFPGREVYANSSEKNENIPSFPSELLNVELEEEKERNIAKKEKEIIDRAKKPDKNRNKEKRPFQEHMRDYPNEALTFQQYMGKDKINTLTNRLIKYTYKEILPNSLVYPTLIKEILTIPNSCPQKCMELIVESMEDQVSGHYETAISRLEKAQEYLPKDINKVDWQRDLFFNLSFGSLYETLGYNIKAMKYFSEAFLNSEKMINVDPDKALPFCFLGEYFVKVQEFDWALRSYLRAKELRENSIGGDTPDTASIYNNLGVVAYCMESYLPADGYFKLAYEIYKNLLGINHPRTMLIKGNLTKMKQLNFNKTVQFKTLSLYPTPAQLIKNPGKKKKK